MSNGCDHGACRLHGESSSFAHHQAGSGSCGCTGGHQCGQCCQSCSKCQCSCHQGCSCGGCCEQQALKLLALADEAWLEVLKERIKDIIASHDSKIEEMAQIIAQANRERWHDKIDQKLNKDEYLTRLEALLHRQNQPKKKR